MAEAVFSIPITGTIDVRGETLTIKVNESVLTVKIEGKRVDGLKRLRMETGQTLFDLVLEAARRMVADFNESEFTAADLYHLAVEKHPDLDLKSNSWSAHVVSSAPNHPSYHHYTARRRFFRYLGNGKYSLDRSLVPESADKSKQLGA